MLREILESVEVTHATIERGNALLREAGQFLAAARPGTVWAIGCGSSYITGMLMRYSLERLAQIPTFTLSAMDFLTYSWNTITPDSTVIAISQSGESFETLDAMKGAKERGATVIGLTNNAASSASRIADTLILTYAGDEKASATKTALAQMLAAYQLGLVAADINGSCSPETVRRLIGELNELPEVVSGLLRRSEEAVELAEELKDDSNLYLVGAGPFVPLALQIANTAREVARVHVNAFDVVEFKHGPLEIVQCGTPVVFISNSNSLLCGSVAALASLVKKAGGRVVALTDEADEALNRVADIRISMPLVSEIAGSVAYLPFLQMFLHELALMKGLNPNEFRNIVKTWTE